VEVSVQKIKLSLYKALIRSVMTYACPTWEYEADAHLLKLKGLQKRKLGSLENLDRCTIVHELDAAPKIFYLYYYLTKLCRTRAELILNHANANVHGIGQREARHRKYERLKLGGGRAYDRPAN
jgi:hypothetical protein